MHLADSIDEACISERKVLGDGHFPVLFDCRGHDFLKTRVDDIDLISALKLVSLMLEAHELKESSLGLDLVLLGETTGSDVIEVLQPFEVGAGDTATIDKHVRCAHNSPAEEDLLSCVGRGAIGTLEDSFDLDSFSVSHVERFLSGGWDHAISLLSQELLGVLTD